jgi:CheY-like chemotaxis protein/HPt (histidine-containing phosphotransfer) domain-containing protein
MGIPPDVQSRLFRPFTQADGSMSRRFGGTGLGLAIASRLAGLMGGEMGVLSEIGTGSIFWFTAEFGVAEAPDKPGAANPLDGRRALVIDGDATSQEMTLRQLAGWGMRVAAATSERDARKALTSAREAGDAIACLLINGTGDASEGAITPRFDPVSELVGTRVVVLGRPEERPAALPRWAAFVSKPVKASDLHDAIINLIAGAEGHVVADQGVAREPVVPTGNRAAGARILLVEDNEINRRIASAMLRSFGYSADTADDGFKALDAASRTQYDLVLMDCQMPGMDGFEATRKLRASEEGGRHVPIVALTANAMTEDRDRCLAAGMDDYLAKPLRPGILRDTLTRWLTGAAPAPDRVSATPPQAGALTEGPTSSCETLDPQAMADIRSLDPEGGDALVPLVDLLLEQSRSLLGSMQAAVKARDAGALAAAAHTLKGASRGVGARLLGDLSAEMERRSREGSAEEAALLDKMRAALDATALAFAAETADYQRAVDPERGAESSPHRRKTGEVA